MNIPGTLQKGDEQFLTCISAQEIAVTVRQPGKDSGYPGELNDEVIMTGPR